VEQILRKESIYCIWSDCCELLLLHLPDEGESTIWELLIQYCENTVFLTERKKKFHFIHLICFSFFPFLAKEWGGRGDVVVGILWNVCWSI